MKRYRATRIERILLDTGGVLTSDIWETLMLTPTLGLADRLGLDHEKVKRAAEGLWRRYATSPRDEADYWHDLEVALFVHISYSTVVAVQRELLKANEGIPCVLDLAAQHRLQLGIISNTTSFWWLKQMDLTGLRSHIDSSLVFLSFEYGRLKEDSHTNLFSFAAERVQAENTLVVDDRQQSIEIARQHGFRTLMYQMDSAQPLAFAIRQVIENEEGGL